MRNRKFTTPMALAIASVCLGGTTTDAQADEWEWFMAPYLWGSGTEVDVFINDEPVIGGDLSFSDLLDKLDMGAQLHFEGRRNKFGFFLDITYLDVSDSQTIEGGPLPPDGTVASGDTTLFLTEIGGTFRPGGPDHGFDLLFGARITDVDMDIDISPPDPAPGTTVSASDTMTDGFVGGRYMGPLGQSWVYTLRGDVGAGDSELVWNLVGSLGYNFGQNDRFAAVFGYRYMYVEYETTDVVKVEVEMAMSGPFAGFAFRF